MKGAWKVGVVIPARNEEKHLRSVLDAIPDFVDEVVVVDDGSTDGTSDSVSDQKYVRLEGEGVGAAIDAGHQKLLEILEDKFVSVVVAGDGQMDLSEMERIIQPITDGDADYVKGERRDRAGKMPKLRRFGTFLLGLLTTLACGQKISDPQCGYTATSSKVLTDWEWNFSWKGYGYPNWWLMNLAAKGYRIKHVNVSAIYEGQKSGIKLVSFMPKVSLMLLLGLHLRILHNTVTRITIPLIVTWVTYYAAWTYNPLFFFAAHLSDRVHVRAITGD